MSTYSEKTREIIATAHDEFVNAETRFKDAERKHFENPRRKGLVPAEYVATAAQAEADYLTAKAEFERVKREMPKYSDQLAALRKNLVEDVESANSIDPAQLDTAVLELLKSGIMRPREYAQQLERARNDGNTVMTRIIGEYAERAAEAAEAKNGSIDPEARALRMIANKSKANEGNERLKTFDEVSTTFGRCISNPAMFDYLLNSSFEF